MKLLLYKKNLLKIFFLVFALANINSWGQVAWAGAASCVNGAASTYLTAANWCTAAVPTSGQIAQFNCSSGCGTSHATSLSITNNSTTTGAIELTSLRNNALTIGNGGTTSNSTLNLDGASVNSISNVVLRNNSSILFTIKDVVASGNKLTNVVLANTTDNIINIDGSGGITISSIISGSNKLSKAGTGSGLLTLSGANTYSGGTIITAGTLVLGAAGVLADAGTITLNGGTFQTGATTGFSETVSTLALTDNSTIALGTGNHSLTFAASNAIAWTAGKTITVTGWTGTIAAGTTGTAGKFFVGAAATGLTATQLAQIQFTIGGTNYPATIRSTGEIVPTLKFVITSISPASPATGVGFSVTVQAQDFDGNPTNVTNTTGFTLSTNGNAGAIGGTTTGSITAGSNSVIVNGVTLASDGTGVTITSTRTSGDLLITGTSATFTVCTPPTITLQPTDQTVACGSSTASFTVATSAGSPTYQWQESTDGGSVWNTISNGGSYAGATTVTLSLSSLTSVFNVYQYRCVVSSAGCSANSNAAILTVNATPIINANPSNANIALSGSTTFGVSGVGNGLSYQWQESINNGAGWSNISNGGIYSNATTAILTLTTVTAGMNEYDYRCVVTNTCSSVNSSAGVLFINREGTYQTIASGAWGVNTTWQRYNAVSTAWANCTVSDFPDYSNAAATVLNGHTVDLDGAAGAPFDLKTLTVNTGGKLWCNSFTGSNSYLQIYGDITCNGTIGTSGGDDICFDIAGGTNCTISGSGSFTAGRIRKDQALNTGSDATLTFAMDVYFTWTVVSGTVLYNDGTPSNFNVTINAGKTLRATGPGPIAANVAIDGNNFSGPDGGTSGGTYTIFGTLDIDGILYANTNNTVRSCNYIVKTGGKIKCRYVRADASASAGNSITVETGGRFNIFGSVDTVTATLKDTTWSRYSATNNIYDFQSGSIMEYSGFTQQLVNGISNYKNMIFSGGGLKKLDLDVTAAETVTFTSGVVQTNANKLIMTSTTATDLIHSTGSASFVFGNLRRYITNNTSTYEYPLGNGIATTNYKRLDMLNNSLSTTSYITGSVANVPQGTPSADVDANLGSLAMQWSMQLTNVLNSAIWTLTPDIQPTAGSYGVNLYVQNVANLSAADDDMFCPIKRDDASVTYADWSTFSSTPTAIPNNSLAGRIYNGGAGYAQRTGYQQFSKHAIAKAPVILPIELLSFTANYNGKNVDLKWVTASELNNDYFTIERSADAVNFEQINTIEGAGTSTHTIFYSTVDEAPLSGISYYRLKQTDFDGKLAYSNIVSVEIQNNNDFQILNIFNSVENGSMDVTVSCSDNCLVNFELYDMTGKKVYSSTQNFVGNNKIISIPTPKLSQGLYLLKVYNGEKMISKKVKL